MSDLGVAALLLDRCDAAVLLELERAGIPGAVRPERDEQTRGQLLTRAGQRLEQGRMSLRGERLSDAPVVVGDSRGQHLQLGHQDGNLHGQRRKHRRKAHVNAAPMPCPTSTSAWGWDYPAELQETTRPVSQLW